MFSKKAYNMNIHNTKSITSRVLLTSIFGMILASTSALADVRLKFNDGREAIMWRDNYIVFYKLCAVGVKAARDCSAIVSLRIPFREYESGLRREFGFHSSRYSGTNGATQLADDIKDTEVALRDPALTAEENANARAKLQDLQRTQLDLAVVDGVLSHLDRGRDITYTEAYRETFAKMVNTVNRFSTPTTPARMRSIPTLGLLAADIGDMCWYDAIERSRATECRERFRKGCVQTLGSSWRLPRPDETTHFYTSGMLPSDRGLNTSGGPYQLDRLALINSKMFATMPLYLPSGTPEAYRWTVSFKTICVANAKDVDPNGDVDGDGIPNHIDRCSKQPENVAAIVNQDGPLIGCAAGQTPDEPAVPGNSAGDNRTKTDDSAALQNIVKSRLVQTIDGRNLIFVNAKQNLRRVAFVGANNQDYVFNANSASNLGSIEFWLEGDAGWKNVSTIRLRITLTNGSQIIGNVSLTH